MYQDEESQAETNALLEKEKKKAMQSLADGFEKMVGGIGLPFYLGNIYGAANAAGKWNLTLHQDLRDRLAVTLDYRY